jgi:hypothetical protein
VVALVREVLWVTAVHPASCGAGIGRVPARPTDVRGVTRGRSEQGRSELVVLVREVSRVTAVYPASCGGR